MKPTYYISKIFVRSVRNLELKVSLFAYPTKRENCYYVKLHHHHHHHHHHHVSFMDLGHLLTLSDLTYPEVSSKVYRDCFCRLGSSISLPWVIYFEAFYLHVASSFSYIPVICPKLVLILTSLKFVHLFCNLSKCIQLFFSCMCNLKCIYLPFTSRCSQSVKLSTRLGIVRWLLKRIPRFNISSRNFLGSSVGAATRTQLQPNHT